jgi:protein-L-isoaspartate(D-aspartate) O-methyltransferase
MSPMEALALAQHLREAVADERVLAAVASVPRECFVPPGLRDRAYENVALPIDCGQTISQPLVVARMLEALSLRLEDRVLDVGTGSGYHAALLGMLAGHVWTIERHAELSAEAERTIRELGFENLTFIVGDGANGLPEQAPFDAINVAAATNAPVLRALEEQLAPGGRLVGPLGKRRQHLIVSQRSERGIERRRLDPVRFVPLVRDRPKDR